jgi:hypothetical protein
MSTLITTPKTERFYIKLIKQLGINAFGRVMEELDQEEKNTAKRALSIYKADLAWSNDEKKEKPIALKDWYLSLSDSASGRLRHAEYLAEKLKTNVEMFFWMLNNPNRITDDHKEALNKIAEKQLNYDITE